MPAASATTFVYVSNAGSQGISVLALAPGGALTPVETVAVPGPAQAGSTMPMSVSRDKKRLYVALRNEPYSAVTFAIDRKTGRLTPVGSGRLADSMAYIFAERGGKFLLGASYGGNKVAVAPIGVDGTVRAARQAVATKNAHCILADKTNTYVLHTSLGEDVVYQHKFNAKSGKLTPNDPSTVSVKAKAGPRHLTFSPDGKFVYLVNELDGSIYAFPWNARTGTLKKEIQIVSASAERLCRQAVGGGHPCHAGRQIPLCLRAHEQHAGGVSRRPPQRHADGDRQLCDGKTAARLRHRPGRALSVRGRPALQQSDRLCDRQKKRRASQAEAIPDGRKSELDRDRRFFLLRLARLRFCSAS